MPALLRPPALRPGDTIRIVSPGSPPDPDLLARGCRRLAAEGYRVEVGPGAGRRRGYLAGSDEERAAELHAAFLDPGIQCLMVGRGGYGSGRLLARLDPEIIAAHPKPVIGYSDMTALLLGLHKAAGLVTFHGPMAAVELGREPEPGVLGSLWKAVNGWYPAAVDLPLRRRPRAWRPGTARGVLVGGCLSLLSSLAGTPWEPDLVGAILFWEETGEDPYRIDRMLAHLKWAGWFDNLAGMIVGRLVDCEPTDKEPSLGLEEILEDHLGAYDFPVLLDFPAGHGPDSVTLPIGVRAVLDSGAAGLEILEPAVERPAAPRRGRHA